MSVEIEASLPKGARVLCPQKPAVRAEGKPIGQDLAVLSQDKGAKGMPDQGLPQFGGPADDREIIPPEEIEPFGRGSDQQKIKSGVILDRGDIRNKIQIHNEVCPQPPVFCRPNTV